MNYKIISWGIFVLLCIIWGSSFILMKWGMYDADQKPVLSPYNVAALRLLASGLVMLPFLPAALRSLPKKMTLVILFSGFIGTFFPAYLFCLAESKIDSGLTACINSLTPLFVIVTGIVFFSLKTSRQKIVGVIVGVVGCILLFSANNVSFGHLAYGGFVILATFFYGINVNMVHEKMATVPSIHIATVSFTGLILPSLIVLLVSGYFKLPLTEHSYALSTLASCILGVCGTALASFLFYVLVKRAGGLFASLVTYGIPFIAILWGVYYGEKITWLHIVALLIILLGVYLANRPEKVKQP